MKKKNQLNNDGKITAVIPVRKGSTRCKNKNIRKFSDTNLLKLKIETLKKVKGIDKILVSSNCNIMLGIGKEMGVDTHKRDEKFCTSWCSGSDFIINLAEQVKTEYILYSTCVTPLISHKLIQKCINFKDKLVVYDSLVISNIFKNFLWNENNPINYELNDSPPSQNLPEYYVPNFSACLISCKNCIKFRNIIGKKPYFVKSDVISGIDIDENSDFINAEILYKENILNEDICKLILEKRKDKIELLDCTIRDGGYLNNWNFSDQEVIDCYKAVSDAGYKYFEIGFKTNKLLLQNKGKWCYCSEEDINKISNFYSGCNIVVMAKVGTVTIDDFIPKKNSNINMVRVLIPRSKKEGNFQKSNYDLEIIKKGKILCEQLLEYGYEVCLNLGCGDIISDEEISMIISEFYNINLKCIYLADTYGGFNSKNLPTQLHKFYQELDKYDSELTFGFHSHNNNEDALEKTKTAIFHGCSIVDSCIGGLGRGAGNLKSEQLLTYIYKDYDYVNKVKPIIKYFNKYILSKNKYNENLYCLQHPYFIISSILSLHPNYISDILNLNKTIDEDIDLILKIDKYTKENNERNYNKNLINIL